MLKSYHTVAWLSLWLIQHFVRPDIIFRAEFKPGRGNVWTALLTPDAWQYRAPQCMSPRWNWDSPTPLPASDCAFPPGPKGGGAHSPAAKGVGESQFQRLEKRLALCLLCAVSNNYWHCFQLYSGQYYCTALFSAIFQLYSRSCYCTALFPPFPALFPAVLLYSFIPDHVTVQHYSSFIPNYVTVQLYSQPFVCCSRVIHRSQ